MVNFTRELLSVLTFYGLLSMLTLWNMENG